MDNINEDMKAFEVFLDALDNRIAVGSKCNDLSGNGTEYLVVDGTIVAKFHNGDLMGTPIGNSDKTAA